MVGSAVAVIARGRLCCLVPAAGVFERPRVQSRHDLENEHSLSEASKRLFHGAAANSVALRKLAGTTR